MISALPAHASLVVKRPATADLEYRPESARIARHLVREKLHEWGLDELIEPAEVIVSELVGNSIRHAGCLTTMRVRIRRIPNTVRISVRDGSRTLPVMIKAGDDNEGHRGLALVQHLAKSWGAELDPRGKTVFADLKVA